MTAARRSITYVEGYVDDLSFFVPWGANITEVLDARIHVDAYVSFVRLAKCLDLFGPAPGAILAALLYSSLEFLDLLLLARRCRGHRRGGRSRRSRSGASGSSPLPAHGGHEVHEVFRMGLDMVGQPVPDLFEVVEFPVHLVGQRSIKTISCYLKAIISACKIIRIQLGEKRSWWLACSPSGPRPEQ